MGCLEFVQEASEIARQVSLRPPALCFIFVLWFLLFSPAKDPRWWVCQNHPNSCACMGSTKTWIHNLCLCGSGHWDLSWAPLSWCSQLRLFSSLWIQIVYGPKKVIICWQSILKKFLTCSSNLSKDMLYWTVSWLENRMKYTFLIPTNRISFILSPKHRKKKKTKN